MIKNCTLLFEEDYKDLLARLKSAIAICAYIRRCDGDSYGNPYCVKEIERHLEAIERVLTKEEL